MNKIYELISIVGNPNVAANARNPQAGERLIKKNTQAIDFEAWKNDYQAALTALEGGEKEEAEWMLSEVTRIANS